jgi:hypothetical protein
MHTFCLFHKRKSSLMPNLTYKMIRVLYVKFYQNHLRYFEEIYIILST